MTITNSSLNKRINTQQLLFKNDSLYASYIRVLVGP